MWNGHRHLLLFFFFSISISFKTEVNVDVDLTCREDITFFYQLRLYEIDIFMDDTLNSIENVTSGTFVGRISGQDTHDGDREFEFGLNILHNCTATREFVKCRYRFDGCKVGTNECNYQLKRNILETNHVKKISPECKYEMIRRG